jgi:peptidyl-prolyl cis-trans isomerase SurA
MNLLLKQAGSKKKLEYILKKSIKQIKQIIKKNIITSMSYDYVRTNAVKKLSVGPAEVSEFLNQLSPDKLPQYNDQLIIKTVSIIPKITELKKHQLRAKLISLKERINGGESFSDLAKQYSEDSASANNGGEIGTFKIGDLDENYEAAVLKLKVGEISDPVHTEYGISIIQLVAKNQDGSFVTRHIFLSTLPIKEELEQDLLKFQELSEDFNNKKTDFESLITSLSTSNYEINILPLSSSQIRIEIQKIPEDILNTLKGLDAPAISKPILVNHDKSPKIIFYYLEKIIKAHTANLKDDYEELYRLTSEAKKAELIDKWLEEARKEIIVKKLFIENRNK